ncbi:MAG: outer membrane beta-barrel protein [Luteibacter sp.]
MQKVLLSVAAAAALSFASLSASAATHDGAFIGVNGGGSHYDVTRSSFGDKTDTAYGVVAGYRWVVDRPFSIGVEVGYVDLGKMTSTDTLGGAGYGFLDTFDYKLKSKAVLVGANGKWDLPNGYTITARAGIAHSRTNYDVNVREDVEGQSSVFANVYSSQSTDNAIYAGLGFGYDFNEHFGITVTYDHYSLRADNITGDNRSANVGVFGGALEYRF